MKHLLGAVWAMVVTVLVAGCATSPAVGRGGPVYEISVATVDGVPTADRGPMAYPACTLQVGTEVARVWLAHPSHPDAVSPVILEGDAEALKDGILVERSWDQAVVYQVTDADLEAGAAVVYVPAPARSPTVVELRFHVVHHLASSQGQHNLAEGAPGLEDPVTFPHVP